MDWYRCRSLLATAVAAADDDDDDDNDDDVQVVRLLITFAPCSLTVASS